MMLGALLDRVKAHPSHSVAFAAAFPPFIIYLDTRARVWALDTLYAIDSAEMVLAATTLGVDHPPGHPLYLILAHLFSKLPFPLPDEGVILTSVCMMTLASTFLSLIIYTHTRRAALAIAAGWTFAFGRVFWFHAAIAEVYAVQLACVCALLYALSEWFRRLDPPWLLLTWFLFGLTATSNILLAVLLLPGVVYATHVSVQGIARMPRFLAICVGCAFLGLTPLAYIPLRLFADGFVSDFVFLGGYEPLSARWILWYFTAEEFTGSSLSIHSAGHALSLLLGFLAAIADNFSAVIPILAAVGSIATLRRRIGAGPADPFSEVLLLSLVITTLVVLPYDVADKEVFFMPSFLFLIAIGSLGANQLLELKILLHFPPVGTARSRVLFPLLLLFAHYPDVSAVTGNEESYIQRETRFQSLPPRATVVSTDDGRATRYKYFSTVRNLRPDVTVETLGRLAPRYAGDEGALGSVMASLNVADRLRVLKSILSSAKGPVYSILDDRMPPELDHFDIRRSPFDPRLVELRTKTPPVASPEPIIPPILSAEDTFAEVDIVGLHVVGLDGGITSIQRGSAIIGRSEFFTLTLVARKRHEGQYFIEVAFANTRLEIPSADGFTAARTLEIFPDDLPVGHFRAERFTLKIPASIPPGPYTLLAGLNRATSLTQGRYKGRPVRSLTQVTAGKPWNGQSLYQPLARILLH